MTPDTNDAFRTCLQPNNTINIISNADVVCITYEGITNFSSPTDFDKKSIESLPATCNEKIPVIADDPSADITAEPAAPGANISLTQIRQLILAVQATKYYTLIGRKMNATNMHCGNILSSFKIERDTYENLRKEDDPDVLVINDKENYSKAIKWVYTFTDCLY